MIVGININMHQASNAGLGHHHHHHPANLDHNNVNHASSTSAMDGPNSTDRLSYSTDHNNDDGTSAEYTMHQLQQQYQHYESFNSSSQQSNLSTSNVTAAATTTTNAPHRIYTSEDAQRLPQQQQLTGILGLEEQFAQFHMHSQQQDVEHSDHPSEIPNDDYVTEADNRLEGEQTEEEPVKLFVGQVRIEDSSYMLWLLVLSVILTLYFASSLAPTPSHFFVQIPKSMNEEDIFPTFNSFGPLKDVTVIRDKHTGIHRGCAFVTYWSIADADMARDTLHDKFIFAGAKRAVQVKPAEPSGLTNNALSTLSSPATGFYNTGNEYRTSHESYQPTPNETDSESKLFVGMLSRTCDEHEVRTLFSQFGEIHEVHLIRNADGSSKCAAFLRFEHRESALQAIQQFNGVEVMDGAQRPLIVKFADSKQQRQQRHIRNIRRHELLTMVGPGGYSYHPQGPPMPMALHPSVAAQYSMAPNGHHHHHHPQYGPSDYSHNTQPQHPYMYAHTHFAAPIPQYAYPHIPPTHQRQDSSSSRPPTATTSSSSVSSNNGNPRPREGPAGANLFVYHLPHDLTDADLATAFNPFGNVISAKVYVDKFTGESKGFGTYRLVKL
jgi:CUG-BP- and ETR3-like factor